jgi:L-arabinose isomerase
MLEIGDTNSRHCFNIGARRFVGEWNAQCPAHHYAAGVDHISSILCKLASLLEMKLHQVCQL